MDVQRCLSFIDYTDLFSQCLFRTDCAVEDILGLQLQVADAIRINQYGLSLFRSHVPFDAQGEAAFLAVAVDGYGLVKWTGTSFRVVGHFYISGLSRSDRFFGPFGLRATAGSRDPRDDKRAVTCVFDRKYVTCQSIGFPYRTEVIDQLVCTDSGVILCRYTVYGKQYTGKNKDQFVSVQHSLSFGFPVIILLLPESSG